MCDSYLRLAPYRLNAVKHCILRKSAAVLISFRFKTVKFMRGNVFPIKCNRMLCFLKERCGAYFVRPVLRAAFFPVYTVWIAFVGFITLGSICITFECINYYIWGHYICWLYYRLQNYGKADRGHKLSLHSRRTSGITKWMDRAGGVRTTKMFILLSLKVHEIIFKFLPLDNCLPRCRIPSCHFQVVAREKEHDSHVHEASVLARTFSSLYMSVCTLYTPFFSR